jgi:uncharacterized membrane protein (DUF106 family)
MSHLNAALRLVFDLALRPFAALSPIVSLLVVSLVVSAFMLVVFKRTSDQARLDAVKRQIHAGLFEIRLFSDDLRAIFRAQLEILRHNLTYLRLSLVPMAWIMPPLVLVMAQLQFHYGYEGLHVGQAALVKADLRPGSWGSGRPSARLDAPPGLKVETEPVWIPSQSQLAWRVVAEREGDFELAVDVAGASRATKSVRVTRNVVRLSPVRVDAGLVSQLLYPAEPPLPSDSAFRAIHVSYASRDVSVLGFSLHWMIPFFALSILFAFVLRRPFKVTL